MKINGSKVMNGIREAVQSMAGEVVEVTLTAQHSG